MLPTYTLCVSVCVFVYAQFCVYAHSCMNLCIDVCGCLYQCVCVQYVCLCICVCVCFQKESSFNHHCSLYWHWSRGVGAWLGRFPQGRVWSDSNQISTTQSTHRRQGGRDLLPLRVRDGKVVSLWFYRHLVLITESCKQVLQLRRAGCEQGCLTYYSHANVS